MPDAPQGNPYLEGPYMPTFDEVEINDLEVIGEIPEDLDGVYLRNGPNPKHKPLGRHHWFDGDGMIHAAIFKNGKVSYRNRWVRTTGLAMEDEAGKALWPGLMDPRATDLPIAWGAGHWLKDVSNTDVVPFNGKAITLFYQCGDAYFVDPLTLETEGKVDLEGLKLRQVSAHSKTDERTGEFLFFDYDVKPPYMTYGVLAPDGSLKHFTPIDLPGARLPHDMAITENYTILHDLPLFWDPELLQRGIHKVTFFPELPSRFGVLPRYGDGKDIKWFETDPCYIYHVVNAWEEGDEVVMVACRHMEPEPTFSSRDSELSRMLAWLRMNATLRRWRFNMKTGTAKEEVIDDYNSEFPMVNGWYTGRKTRYSYNVTFADTPTLWFNGIVKYDLETGASQKHFFPEGWVGSESPFAPRVGATDEDDGYVVSFVSNAEKPEAEIQVFDAKDIARGPIARALVPARIPAGFHSCWVPGNTIA